MNKKEYMLQLEKMMADFDDNFKNEILNDFNEHFEQGKLEGRSEEEIARSLGDASDLIAELKTENKKKVKQEIIKSEVNQIDRISVEGRSARVVLRISENNKISYELTDHNAKVNIHNYIIHESIDENTLYIKLVQRGRRIFNFDLSDLVLNVFVPVNMQSIAVSTISGDVDLIELCAEEFCIKTTSGTVHLKQLQGAVSASTVSGDINGKGLTGNLALNSISGDISLKNCSAAMIKLKTISGDVDFYSVFFQMAELHTTSGDIDFEGSSANLAAETKSGDLDIICHDAEGVKIDSLSGDLSLILPECSGLKCALKTVSGDIDLNLLIPYRYNKTLLTSGDEHCAVSLKTVSGDITVKDHL